MRARSIQASTSVGIEPEQVPELDVWDSTLGNEPSDVANAHAEPVGELVDVDEAFPGWAPASYDGLLPRWQAARSARRRANSSISVVHDPRTCAPSR